MEKFGAKEKHHKIFAWLQFQHSMLKCDLGLIIYLLIALFVFNNSNWVLLALDIIYLAFSIGFVMAMKKYVRII